MKPAPSNRNVPQHVWDDAQRQFQAYLDTRSALMKLGLSDPQADEYIEALRQLENLVERLDPIDMDFVTSDHTERLKTAAGALRRMTELLART